MRRVLSDAGVLDSTRFFGNVSPPSRLRQFYHNLDVCVMLSKKEGLSIAMLEAMASGVATAILSPWGDDAIIDGKTGLKLRSDNANDIADALWPLIEDPNLASRMGVAAAQHMKDNFAPEIIARKLIDVYEMLLN